MCPGRTGSVFLKLRDHFEPTTGSCWLRPAGARITRQSTEYEKECELRDGMLGKR